MRASLRLISSILFVPLALACGGPADPGTADSGLDAAIAVCGSDAECSDGLFCNGVEDCDPNDDAADANGCVAAAPACGADGMCSEAADMCLDVCEVARDADGDGRENAACGGDDCDDADPSRFPGNLEICDLADRDEDCDASTFGFRDADGDGSPDAACCNVVGGGPPICGGDCDDLRPGSNPDNPEVCNTRDDDCDGSVDEEVRVVLYADADGDGFGSAATDAATMVGCGPSVGWQVDRSDCDDGAVSVHPGATEECNGLDDDCDTVVDDRVGGCACSAGVTQDCSTEVGECTAGSQTCTSAGVWGTCSGIEATAESCDAQDDDCDGVIDEGVGITCYLDTDGDGYAASAATGFIACRDPNPARSGDPYRGCAMGSTGTPPITALPSPSYDCSDSNAAVTRPRLCYPDDDRDGSARLGSAPVSSHCGTDPCPAGQAPEPTDCCDTDATSGPGATYAVTPNACGSLDRNCDGTVSAQYGNPTGRCVPNGGGTSFCFCDNCRGYTGTPPACGETAPFVVACAAGDGACYNNVHTQQQGCR